MFKITRKHNLTDHVFRMDIEAPAVAEHTQPGHYIDIRVNPDHSALTLPVVDCDRNLGTVSVVHRAQDLPSVQFSMLVEGDEVFEVRGPLGSPCTFPDVGKVVLAAEDLGVASLFCRARTFRERGAYTICILGFENKSEVFWEDVFGAVSDELYVCTRDGSYGVNGGIAIPMRAVCETYGDVERVVAMASLAQMRKAAKIAAEYDIPAVVSFDAIRPPIGSPGIFDVPDWSQEAFEFAKAPEIDAGDVDFEKLLAKEKAFFRISEDAANA
jgi:NAD(P)H-flavin reductase